VGALDSIPKLIVLQLVKKALKIMPCQITLVEGRSDELLRELSSHRIDLLVTNFLPLATAIKGIKHRTITKKNIAFYAAPKFKQLRKNFPQSLHGQPLILPTYDSKLRYDLDQWEKANELVFDVLIESQDISVKKLMAVEGLGLMPTATHTVTQQVLAGELIEIGQIKNVFEELVLVSAERKIENPLASQLMKTFNV
jgi:LysR family transcriptional activator of nhaA